jgi:hypothetical protein
MSKYWWSQVPSGTGARVGRKTGRVAPPNLRICAISRPEADISSSLASLASHIVSLHDEDGQKKDIADYVRSVVYSDKKMRRWRNEDKETVIDALSRKANGM